MSDRTDAATRDPSAPEPEPDAELDRTPPNPRRSPTATVRPRATAGADGFTDWFDREFEGDLAPDRESPDRRPEPRRRARRRRRRRSPAGRRTCRPGSARTHSAAPVRRIFRRPTEWATSDWPTRRIVQVVFTVFSLAVTTAIMMNVVHSQPVVVDPRPRVRRHHADGRRLRRPRLGSGVPPRLPASRVEAQRVEHGLVRGHARLPLLHGGPGACSSSPSTPCSRTASP